MKNLLDQSSIIKSDQKPITLKIVEGSKNWGDKASIYLVELLTGKKPRTISIHNSLRENNATSFLAIGSILGFADENSVVWGSGFVADNERIKGRPKIRAVRGPMSWGELLKKDIDCPKIYGDPALLLPRFYSPSIKKQFELGIIPHFVDKEESWFKKPLGRGTKIIDIEGNFFRVIEEILSCKKIASSSLHGIIIADAYGIPSLWVEFSNKVIGGGFKFRDYFLSVGRRETNSLKIRRESTIKEILDNFKDYKIDIDLDKLLEACPFK